MARWEGGVETMVWYIAPFNVLFALAYFQSPPCQGGKLTSPRYLGIIDGTEAC